MNHKMNGCVRMVAWWEVESARSERLCSDGQIVRLWDLNHVESSGLWPTRWSSDSVQLDNNDKNYDTRGMSTRGTY